MTTAVHPPRSRLVDIGGVLAGRPQPRAGSDHDCARSHARAPINMARQSPPNPCLANHTANNPESAQLQAAKLTPLAMPKSP
jgi:hypothetical protein